jgi:hypothetical protein
MDNAFSPREIQARIRSGASVADVVSASGLEAARVEAFAGPVLAEREHIAAAARTSTVRRRGETGSHRKLGDLIAQRLRARGVDDDRLAWDAWRQADLKWRVVAKLPGEVEERSAEFVFDAKGRFSVADNADARWMIGEEQVRARPEDENTVDLNDELALVRAVAEPTPEEPGGEVPASDLMHDGNEDTSQLDRLYDMLSGISEDSVRIYTGMFDDTVAEGELEATTDVFEEDDERPEPAAARLEPSAPAEEPALEPAQEPLVDADDPAPASKPRGRKKRASIPSWDEIMFGGPTP